jgi:hypothetical protein
MTIANEHAQKVLDWFEAKGITGQTVADFEVEVLDDGAVAFSYGNIGRKLRYGVPTGERSFRWARGVDPVLFNRRDLGKRHLFLCEGETDTMRLRQELGDNPDVGTVGLPGIETWNEGMAIDLRGTERVYVILDNDLDYQVAGRVDGAWRNIRNALGTKARRIILPKGVNDLCEFFEDHGLDSLRLLAERSGRPGESRFKTLDLTIKPQPPRWIVEDLFCQGDVHLLIGEPNIGKSFLTMALAVAIANGDDTYLDHRVMQHGRVLYIDEENPEDLVIDRMTRLGLRPDAAENIRYLNNLGVRLDKDPHTLIDEAIDFSPVLIILDSLTALHSQDENSAGSMSALFNDAVVPLARQADAGVVLVHHVSKTDSTSSFKRSRGSSDITGRPDTGYDVYASDDGTLKLKNFKARRAAQIGSLYVFIKDTDEGGVAVTSMPGFGKLF